MTRARRTHLLVGTALLAGCATVITSYEALYGPSAPTDRVRSAERIAAAGQVSFERQVRPILDQRCIVRHSCNDAPCQLDLTSYEALDRGASPMPVYNGARLATEAPTRIGIDARTTAGWRARGFHPVLNERADTALAHLGNSLLYQTLVVKRADAFPSAGRLPPAYAVGSELETDKNSLVQPNACPAIERYAAHARSYPQWGMPFGFPALTDQEFRTIETWLTQGSPVEPEPALAPAVQREIAKWEEFPNGESNKQRLMARYL